MFGLVRKSKLIEAENKYRRLRANMWDARQWLAEYRYTSETIQWLLDSDDDYYRPIAAPAKTSDACDIQKWREKLRSMKNDNVS